MLKLSEVMTRQMRRSESIYNFKDEADDSGKK